MISKPATAQKGLVRDRAGGGGGASLDTEFASHTSGIQVVFD